jgi:hypothetical protein
MGTKELVTSCEDCPFCAPFDVDDGCTWATACYMLPTWLEQYEHPIDLSYDESIGEKPPHPEWCPLRVGDVTVTLKGDQ